MAGNFALCNLIIQNFKNFSWQCQVAVNKAIEFTTVHDEAEFVVAWINYRQEHFYATLRAVIFSIDAYLLIAGGGYSIA